MASKKNNLAESSETRSFFDNLYFQREGSWFSLPGWAKFFLKLGEHLSHYKHDNTRFIAALAVPTRSYASAFIASGITCGRSRVPYESTDQEYFAMLESLENGTPVVFREKGRKFNAKKREVIRQQDGKHYIGIQIDEGNKTTKYILAEHARLIEIADMESIKLPHQQKGREISPPSKLVKAILGDDQVYDFVSQTRLESVVIGPINSLKQELNLLLATSQATRCDCPGYLSDLLRVRDFQSPGIASRSSILAAISRSNIKVVDDVSPFVVIFDGSHGFVKWRDYWRQFNWVVVLDQTDPNFQYAVTQINQEYLYR